MSKIKNEQIVTLAAATSPTHLTSASSNSGSAFKAINLANVNFKNNKKLVKRIAFSSLGEFSADYTSASLSDFRSEVINNLNRVNSNKLQQNTITFNATSNTPTITLNSALSNNASNNNVNTSIMQLPNSANLSMNNSNTNLINSSRDPFTSQSITKFFQEERNASIYSKADIHKRIMEIGDSLHANLIRDLQVDYEKRLKQKENELNEQFKREREMQVEKERSKFSEKLESIKAQLKKDYERLLRERANEIETYTQNVSKEQIELNKIEAKRLLEDTVRKQREQFEIEKFEAVEEAILKEKQISESKLEEQRKKYENRIEDLNEKWIGKLNSSLQEQRAKLNKEIEKTIQLSCEQLISDKNNELEKIRDEYEAKLDLSKFEIQLKLDDIAQLNGKVSALNYENDELKAMIEELKQELQSVITRFSYLKKNDNDFLFPVNTSNIELKKHSPPSTVTSTSTNSKSNNQNAKTNAKVKK